ncbi:MAG: 2-amino-4-hydroxy-6-hydroxymethyldihydropteridine diphosphokinase [Prevotella sp.]|nr:2-amino-4-hydroxy-6-hydroxymethyldihydropteridine diphosphokinase [Prevotella sp.]
MATDFHMVYLALGSNIGDRRNALSEAIRLIDERVGRVDKVSSFMETEPWGFKSEFKFLNAVLSVQSMLSPIEILHITQNIEKDMGREKKSLGGIYHDRIIDIDLLMYDSLQLDTPELTLPHPHMKEREFVMIPLMEILS